MKGDIASAIALVNFDPTRSEHFRSSNNVRRFSVAAQRDDGRVLKQEEHIADASLFPKRDQLLL